MKRSTAWWIIGTAMLLIGMILARLHASAPITATPAGIAFAVATSVGYAVGVALIALIVAAFTRFKYPWAITSVYGFCVIATLVAIYNNQNTTTPTISQESQRPWDQQNAASSSTTTPNVVDVAAEEARWDADARAFIAAHPDLQFNENLEIMGGYTRALTRNNPRGYDNATILAIAYNAAKSDPRWSKHDIVISMHG